MTSSGEGGAQIRDGATGQATGKPIAIQDWLHIAAFTTDGERIVVASGGSIAQLWNAATGEQIGKPMQHDAEVSTAHFSFDDKRVLTTSANNTARVWDAFTGDALGPPIRYEGAWDAVFSRDGMRLLTMSADNSARVWDATTGNAIGESMPHVAGLDNAIFSRDGQYILTSSRDHMARRWDATNGAAVGEPMHHEDGLTSAVFSPDGSQVLTTGRFSACLWNLDGRCVGKLDCNIMPREGAVSLGCSFSPEGSLLSAQLGPTLLVVSTAQLDWPVSKINATDDVAAELELVLGDAKVRMDGAPGPVRSPDGKRQVSVLPDGRLRIIDADSGREAAALRPEMPAAGVMFTSDGTRLVVTVKDAPALIWDARDPSARRADWDARADERRPAEDYIKELLRGPREIDELETAIRADKEIPPIRRLVALEVLREKVAQFRVEAKALFRTIAEDHIAPERIRAAVRAMTDLPPRVSESLLALAKDLEGDSGQLNQLAWKHVSEPGASPDRLELALDTARQALALAPTNPDVAKTLGAALYRHGDYADAIKTLEFGPKRIGEPRPVELACLAMSYHQLNQKTEAKSSILSLKQVVEVKNYWLVGTVDERGLLFKSRDDGETSEGEVILANDGQSFHGQWRTEGGGGWESFAGKRLVGAALDRFEGLWSTDWGTLLLFSDEEKLCGAYADESLVYEAFLLLNEPFPSLPDVGLYSTPDARRPASDE
jgi:WD40 repeat protein